MNRPSSPELDAILSATEELRDLEARFAEAKRQLASKVDALGQIVEPADRLRAAVYAYWHAPEVSANQLAVLSVGKPSAMVMLRRFGSVSIGITCDRCSQDLPITSRSMMQDVLRKAANNSPRWAGGYRFVCPDCREALDDEFDQKMKIDLLIRKKRRRIVARMTYTEYLETPEWKSRRDYVMSCMLEKRGRLTCEVCPERQGLSFVHSQFDLAGGHEAVSLLCATCSDALERAGKLAQAPLPANRAPRIELDLAEREFRTHHYGGAAPTD